MNKVFFRKSVLKELESLPAEARKRVEAAIREMEKGDKLANPRFCVKLAGREHTDRVRVGRYRIIFEMPRENEIVIVRIRHRKDAY